MDSAWNGWRHLLTSTYGAWLPGDPRGFRTRGHREHVAGDYTNPPPKGLYDQRHEQAKRLLKRSPVVLSPPARRTAVQAVHHALVEVHQIEVLAISVSATHLHLLARFDGDRTTPTATRRGLGHRDLKRTNPPRFYLGVAKERSAKALANAGLVEPGGVWARRGKIKPIRDREHQINTFNYILKHAKQGTAVWSFKDKIALPDPQ